MMSCLKKRQRGGAERSHSCPIAIVCHQGISHREVLEEEVVALMDRQRTTMGPECWELRSSCSEAPISGTQGVRFRDLPAVLGGATCLDMGSNQ